ncbi:hypothetical protein Y032_0009g672 [Ancylostoma ceylanicum]|uniref:Uncharacterized protein n=1 Tax=Ancylostoma ceylanicum TaxID=53326 RepID=A0A016VIV6_9BILA|nr:hypothetical protein Y032_0009g672 [Ancylostoma ceylanicum]
MNEQLRRNCVELWKKPGASECRKRADDVLCDEDDEVYGGESVQFAAIGASDRQLRVDIADVRDPRRADHHAETLDTPTSRAIQLV